MMKAAIGTDLELVPLPPDQEIGAYDSFDVEWKGIQVGKARCRIEARKLTVFSIGIYPEFQRQGFARAVVDHLKGNYDLIVADRVRFTARPFWEEMGFHEEGNSGDFSWSKKRSVPEIGT